MDTAQLRKETIRAVRALPKKRLPVVYDFVRFIEQRESDEATEELLRIPGILDRLAEARQDRELGRCVPMEKLRHKWKR